MSFWWLTCKIKMSLRDKGVSVLSLLLAFPSDRTDRVGSVCKTSCLSGTQLQLEGLVGAKARGVNHRELRDTAGGEGGAGGTIALLLCPGLSQSALGPS